MACRFSTTCHPKVFLHNVKQFGSHRWRRYARACPIQGKETHTMKNDLENTHIPCPLLVRWR